MEEWSEIVELDKDRWITLEFAREWPKYVCDWSIRHRVGDGDFPVTTGRVDHMPPREGETLEDVFEALKVQAIESAKAAATQASTAAPPRNRGLLKRLFGS